MSFFDEGDPPPRTRAQPRARRPAGGAAGADADAIRNRRLVALGLGIVLFLLFAILVRGCLDSRADDQLRDYNRQVAEIMRASDGVSRDLFGALRNPEDAVELEATINGLAQRAERQQEQAEGLDVPSSVEAGQRNLLLALDLRTTALRKIARDVQTALAGGEGGDQPREATDRIAGSMQAFLTSDVIYDTRVVPFIQDALREREISGQRLYAGQFLPSLDWLRPQFVGQQIGSGGGSGDGGDDADGPVAPGRHGHALSSVSVGDTTLEPGETANRIPAGAQPAFTVRFANQGENDERNVQVRIRITGGGDPVTATRRVEQTQEGSEAEVTIPLSEPPPIGTPVEITAEVARVPGEQITENNRQTYTAIFER
jgi:hypothetical protein